MKIVYIMLAVVALIIGSFVMAYVSANNTGNTLEQNIISIQSNSMNVAAKYQNLIFEAAQVPEMQRDDLKDVVTAALNARYGDEGSKALFQALSEDNPKIDSAVYIKLQQIMESGRNEFSREQSRLIDATNVYKVQLGNMPGSFFLRLAGYPTINLDDFKPVVTSRVNDMFETKTEEHIKLRP